MAVSLPIAVPAANPAYERNLERHLQLFPELPAAFLQLSRDELMGRIGRAKKRLGESTIILGHNYQADDIVRFADATGDSYQLSVIAKASKARNIVFCGVTFMAETAEILTEGERNVIIPSLEASCPMAGMSEMIQVDRAWRAISAALPSGGADLLPVTYINSYADLKAFTGEKGGIICTSANAEKAFQWAFNRGKRVFFTPDKHLGRNVARKLGVPSDEVAVWNPWKPGGGVSAEAIANARVIVWEGYCQVHDRFKVEHVEAIRKEHPDIQIVVHPECRPEVVALADFVGSTNAIASFVEKQPAGAKMAIGTEIHMVKRLAREHPDRYIVQLCGEACLDCNAMRQVDPRYLCWVLEELTEGRVMNRVSVPEDERALARRALDRMLEL
ncbi:MAG: quinolinate synthase NadA [Thermoplasmatota archaeon]